MNAFGIGPNLYPLRLILPIIIIYFSVLFFQKSILFREKIKIQPILSFSLLFFLYYFFHTYIVSFLRHTLFGYNYELNSILNFTFLLGLILTFFLTYLSDTKKFFKIFNCVTLLFYFLYGLYAFYEVITGNHLPTSDLFDAPYWLRYSPTVVYYNSNDFASIFTLMFMYLLSTYDKEKTLSILWLFLMIFFHLIIVYYSQSRISLLVSLLFLGFRYPFKLAYSSILGVLILLVGITVFEPNWNMQFLDGLKELKTDLLFSDRQSTSIRLYLYKHSIMSIFSSYGVGYGVDYSLQYFQSINDPNLSHIVNPHSFIFEILINSGVLVFLGFITLNIYLIVFNILSKDYDLVVQVILFNLLLFSSSSTLFIWTIYLFIFIYICRSAQHQTNSKIYHYGLI